MKKTFRILFMITVLLITFSSSNYVDAASYDTKASITFIEPKEEKSSEVVDLEAGVIPGGDIVEESKDLGSAESTLPKTATSKYSFLLLGLVIMIAGVSFFVYSNCKEKRS